MPSRFQIVRAERGATVYSDVPGEQASGNESYVRQRAYLLQVKEAFTLRREIGIHEIDDAGARTWLTDQTEDKWTRFKTTGQLLAQRG